MERGLRRLTGAIEDSSGDFEIPINFKVDNEAHYYGYDLVCLVCGFRITPKMKYAHNNRWCPSCGIRD